MESGSVQRNEIHQIETNIKKIETEKKVHKEDAFKACESIIQWLTGVKVCGKRLQSLSRNYP